MAEPLTVLGIESSCDETAAAVVSADPHPRIRVNLIHAQLAEHAPYGGVVPEIAARAHLDHIDGLIRRALTEAGIDLDQIDGIAAAAGPGLIGGLIVGTMAAKGIAWAARKPFIAVNHLEAHALTARLSDGIDFPYLLLLVSGGHSQLLICAGVGRYRQLGTSRDDAAGEAFDKTAKLLGLGFPGGPAIEQAAQGGNPARFTLPRPLKGRNGCDFSFSGLKTAVVRTVERTPDASSADVAASFQEAVVDVLVVKARRAVAATGATGLCLAGGVAANSLLRRRAEEACRADGVAALVPSLAMCTDNAAMIAAAGAWRLEHGGASPLSLGAEPSLALSHTD